MVKRPKDRCGKCSHFLFDSDDFSGKGRMGVCEWALGVERKGPPMWFSGDPVKNVMSADTNSKECYQYFAEFKDDVKKARL